MQEIALHLLVVINKIVLTLHSEVELVSWEGEERLSWPHLDTWLQGTPLQDTRNWPETLATHCRSVNTWLQGTPLQDPRNWPETLATHCR
jgi:hypothetical protein